MVRKKREPAKTDEIVTKLTTFKSNIQHIFRTLKEKPENHVGRIFLSEALNAVIEQEFDSEFEVVVSSASARRELIQLLDLAKKLRSLRIIVSLELMDGSVEDEKVILCTMVWE